MQVDQPIPCDARLQQEVGKRSPAPSPPALLRWYLQRQKKHRSFRQGQGAIASFGFTLAELLITLVISSIIVTGLLTLVVDLVTSNRKELARTETQREMTIASEYMSSELREAAYVYTGECLWGGDGGSGQTSCPGLFQGGGIKAPANSVPVIGFWKLDPLPLNCTATACADYAVAQRSYTLVFYFLSTADSDRWAGKARLTRAELARFKASGELGDLGDPKEDSPDPATAGVTFRSWKPKDGISKLKDVVLVDYVDATADTDANVVADNAACPENYKITPSSDSLTGEFKNVRSVYACVRDDVSTSAGTGSSASSFNQKVVLFVRGNPQGRYGLDAQACGDSLKETLRTKRDDLLTGAKGICNLPTVKTEVLNRGVANKVPRQLGGTLPTGDE